VSLGKHVVKYAPKTSWWQRQGRAFLIALAANRARMLEGSGRISRPTRQKAEA